MNRRQRVKFKNHLPLAKRSTLLQNQQIKIIVQRLFQVKNVIAHRIMLQKDQSIILPCVKDPKYPEDPK